MINCLMYVEIVDSSIDIYRALKKLEKFWRVSTTTRTIQHCWKHINMIFGDTLKSCSTDTSSVIASQNVELADVLIILLNRLSQLSIDAEDCESIVLKNAQKYVHFEVVFDLNQPHAPTKKDILNKVIASKVLKSLRFIQKLVKR